MNSEEIDHTIIEYIRHEGSGPEEPLVATGEPGLQRVLELWFGRSASRLPEMAGGPQGKAAADAWSATLSVVARANPGPFIDGIAGEPMSTTLLAILGDLNDPRVTEILCGHLADADWLLRYNAVASLCRRAEDPARSCLERALLDENLVVRSQAIKGVSRWDPSRAITLYEELLAANGLTPLLRSEATAALNDLRAGGSKN